MDRGAGEPRGEVVRWFDRKTATLFPGVFVSRREVYASRGWGLSPSARPRATVELQTSGTRLVETCLHAPTYPTLRGALLTGTRLLATRRRGRTDSLEAFVSGADMYPRFGCGVRGARCGVSASLAINGPPIACPVTRIPQIRRRAPCPPPFLSSLGGVLAAFSRKLRGFGSSWSL